MTEWWQQAYKGGPMVAVPGFPRELHVGDAHGPDVIAYKRTVWRACRWQGPASRFDDIFSEGFSLGCGPNVIDTGIAGVQRQQKLSADGVVDTKTFNTLRSIRVPEGKPNAGQMAMDANAANLIALAYEQFQPKPAPPTTVRERALAGAAYWIGTTEIPGGSNLTPFGAWYGMDGQPWCAMFATYCFVVEAGGSPSFVRGARYAFVPYVVADAAQARYGLTLVDAAHVGAGDIACFDWEYDGTFDHVELVEAPPDSAGNFRTIGGNTSSDDSGSQSNGGGVYRRQRSTRQASVVFVRVAEP